MHLKKHITVQYEPMVQNHASAKKDQKDNDMA